MFVKPFLREQLVGLLAEVGKEHPAIQVNQSHSMTMLRFIFSFFLLHSMRLPSTSTLLLI